MSEEEKETIEIMLEDMFFWQGKSSFITRHRYKELSKKMYKEIEKLQKENQELKEENKKINKVADKMYEYISYYGWEDFESNTGCNREEMVDYFYKE